MALIKRQVRKLVKNLEHEAKWEMQMKVDAYVKNVNKKESSMGNINFLTVKLLNQRRILRKKICQEYGGDVTIVYGRF